MYCIVDIETTGNGIVGNKITEVSIFKTDGENIVDEFTSLVNPGCEIPYFITGLTGIDNDLVRDAPSIEEIAPSIEAITRDAVFVAHSVNFDYNVIREEFRLAGLQFSRKKLCTVRLSRRLFPGYASYSLGKLCSALDIPLTDRHRARGDAHATLLLFHRILNRQGADALIKKSLNARSQEATLPPSLPKESFDRIPRSPGIYYFKDKKGKIIYVGKAKNLRQRVLGHFYDKSSKEITMCRETAAIDFELSGSELVALLMESAQIKHHFPKYNRAQKNPMRRYGIFSYEDRNGVIHLAFNNARAVPNPHLSFYNTTDCRLYLEHLCELFSLCPKFCHLQENVSSCSHFRLNGCEGICRGEESPAAYNEKVALAIKHMKQEYQNLIIREKGRSAGESAVVLMQDGLYSGYGFVPEDVAINSIEDILAFVIPQQDSLETKRLVHSYIAKNPEKVISFEMEAE